MVPNKPRRYLEFEDFYWEKIGHLEESWSLCWTMWKCDMELYARRAEVLLHMGSRKESCHNRPLAYLFLKPSHLLLPSWCLKLDFMSERWIWLRQKSPCTHCLMTCDFANKHTRVILSSDSNNCNLQNELHDSFHDLKLTTHQWCIYWSRKERVFPYQPVRSWSQSDCFFILTFFFLFSCGRWNYFLHRLCAHMQYPGADLI